MDQYLSDEQTVAEEFGVKYPRDRDDKMSAVVGAVEIARTLEKRERGKVLGRDIARARIAEKLRIGIGTFENLVRGRIKRIDADLRDRVHALFIRELEHEIAQLTHQLAVARITSDRPDSPQVFEAKAHLAAAHALLSKNPT